jgi:DNA-directed RNA polymerase specialized sigma24 family protein
MRRLPAAVSRLPLHVRAAAEIEALQPRERQVLALCLVEQLTPLEAAGALHMPVGELERTLASTLEQVAAALATPRARRTAKWAA